MKWCKVLVCVCFGLCILLTDDVVPGSGSLHSATGETRAAASDTVKKKIKKTEESPLDKIIKRKEKKGGPDRKTEESQYDRVSEEKSSFWGDCFSDLLVSICSGMVSSALDGDEEEPAPEVELEEPITIGDVTKETQPESGPSSGDVDSPGTLPYTATVMPVDAGETTVLLWDWPGGAATRAAVLDTLTMGAEVSVIKISQIENIFWVKVETAQVPKLTGWMLEEETSPIEVPDTRK